MKRKSILSVVALITLIFIISSTSYAQIVVTNLNDMGAGSLREAIDMANTNPGPDEITFQAGLMGTITLETGEMAITDDLTITAPGADVITIDADNESKLFNIDDSDPSQIRVEISGLRLANGRGENSGGAILNEEDLIILGCNFFDNTAIGLMGGTADGGAIQTSVGLVIIIDSTFDGNSAEVGGAMSNGNGGVVSVTNSTFSNNIGNMGGGALFNASGCTMNITNSTFFGNLGVLGGGGIINNGDMLVASSTFNSNVGGLLGGAIGITPGPEESTTVRNSIFASNNPDNCGGAVTDGDYNIEDDNTCGFSGNSQVNTNPDLDPSGLQDNGGPTLTIALEDGSPAIDAIPDGVNFCRTSESLPPFGRGVISTDQRGFVRPIDGDGVNDEACDIGAFEFLSFPDADYDGISDDLDECPNDPNNDVDDDDVCGDVDNCPDILNTDQTDTDEDGEGDACDVDDDGDGVNDDFDDCPFSNTEPTVVIDGCDSSVENFVSDDGCTIADSIEEVETSATNHGRFVSGVSALLNELKKAGLISGSEKDAIQMCSASADLP